MITSFLLAAGLLTGPVETLVLKSGATIPIEQVVTVDRGSLVFVGRNGTLFSLPLDQIDIEATEAPIREETARPARSEGEETPVFPVGGKLPHSEEEIERILKQIETYSHTGEGHGRKPAPVRPVASDVEVTVEGESDEEEWRRAAAGYTRRIAALEQEIAAMVELERQLNDQLLFLAGGSGDAGPYAYLVYELQDVRASIPLARKELERANRAYQDFRQRARKLGIPPGWTR